MGYWQAQEAEELADRQEAALKLLDDISGYQSIDITHIDSTYHVALNKRVETFPFPSPRPQYGLGATLEEAFHNAVKDIDDSIGRF